MPNDGSVTVVSADSKPNSLAVQTSSRERVSYDPSKLRTQTAQSKIYREETRDLAVGDRIQFTTSHREQRVRSGDFATVERIGQDNSIGACLDNGRAVELAPDQAQHNEHGCAVATGQRVSADRILVAGESVHPKLLAGISASAKDVAVYTSDGSSVQKQPSSSSNDLSQNQSPPQQQNQGHGLGIGLGL